jgi:nucleoside transporter
MGSPSTSSASGIPPMAMGLRVKLSVMMFLQFAIWGAWFVTFWPYMQNTLGFKPETIGWIFSTMALGTIFSPMLVGLIADRYFATEKMIAALHLAGAALLYLMANVTTPTELFIASLGYALIYGPTLALTNSISFRHIPDATRDFPGIRVMGTLGWIAVSFAVGKILVLFTPLENGEHVAPFKTNLPFMLAAGLSVVLALLSLLLPHTPPSGKAGEALPFKKAIVLLKQPSFAVFFAVSFFITIAMAFYYGLTPGFLTDIGVKDPNSIMTIGQWAELVLLPFLPWFLFRFGMKGVLIVGMLAWGVRYAVFALGEPYWLVIGSLALHGVCFDFFFAAAFIYVDNEAPTDIRASAQSLFLFLTYGVGMFVGGVLSGDIQGMYTHGTTTDWRNVWIVPSVGILICASVFILFFRTRSAPSERGEILEKASEVLG